MSIKVTKKDLKQFGKDNNGYYLGGNVYNYENILYYLQIKDVEGIKRSGSNKGVSELIAKINLFNKENINIYTKQLFYSAGIYGNNGQVHNIKIYNKDNTRLFDCFIIYYC